MSFGKQWFMSTETINNTFAFTDLLIQDLTL